MRGERIPRRGDSDEAVTFAVACDEIAQAMRGTDEGRERLRVLAEDDPADEWVCVIWHWPGTRISAVLRSAVP